MKIVLIGSTTLTARCLLEIHAIPNCPVTGVVTNPETFKISYNTKGVRNVLYGNMVEEANRNGIPSYIMQEKMTESGLLKAMGDWKPDLLLVIGWYHMVPKRIRDMASFGCVGLHASLLPQYRGGAPLVWAMIEGEKETGVTLFHLDDGVDNGDIIGQERFEIGEDDTISHLVSKSAEASTKLLKKYLPLLAEGKTPRIKQDESMATQYPQRSPEDGRIDWSWPSDKIRRFIRAQTKPYPGAFTEIGGKRIRIWDAEIETIK